MLKKLLQGIEEGIAWEKQQVQKFIGGAVNFALDGREAALREIKCLKCNEVNTVDSKYCGACGASFINKIKLNEGVTCACGFMNVKGQKFCSECGASQDQH
ncbi:MAG: zinc ribbon domain-containing protein [Defluviitaleaceae bacterium]|nr:zinc ribbon domain-containing protein [Defluviitaleaceae bacterium]MCL2238523.1 zinc ribbon domain-containing protein [Defluviitaleaceae bacterium]